MNTRGKLWDLRAGGVVTLLFLYLHGCLGAEWPQYRGPRYNGTSTDRIIKQWTGSVTNPVWLARVTNCLGSVTVSGGRVFTQTRRAVSGADKEVCIALSATQGTELWATPVDDASYPESGVGYDDGPRSTPVADGGSVFVLSSYHKLWRLNATNGAVIWQKDLSSIYGGAVIPWQSAASPLVEDGLIYVNANCGTSTLMALRAIDGEPAWRSQDEGMTHSTPMLTTIHGVRQVIFATQSGLVSLNSQSGELLWRMDYPFFYGTSLSVSPVVFEDMVFVCGAHSYGMGAMVVQVDLTDNLWTARQLWYTTNPTCHWMTPVVHEGFLYGAFGIQQFDSPSAQLKCIDMRTGAVRWSANNFGRGATILVDDHLLSLTERGELVLSRRDPNAYTEVARLLAIPAYHSFSNKCWNTFAVSDGRVYVRSTAYVACFDLSVPDLRLYPAVATASGGTLQLTIRTGNGTPLDSNRLAGMEVLTTTGIERALPQWFRLTNRLVLTNGVVRIDNVDAATQPQRFFIVSEPEQ